MQSDRQRNLAEDFFRLPAASQVMAVFEKGAADNIMRRVEHKLRTRRLSSREESRPVPEGCFSAAQ
jgi:hypothetical protein